MTINLENIELVFSDAFNQDEIETFRQTIKANVESLGIALQKFKIDFQKDAIGPSHALGMMSPLDKAENLFGIAINSLNDIKKSIWAIGHELVHIRQYLNGQLKDDFAGSYWMDGEHTQMIPHFLQRSFYNQLPWEVEAHGLQERLFNKAMTAIGRAWEAEGYNPWQELKEAA